MKPPPAPALALPSIRRRLSWQLVGVALVWGLAVSGAVWVALASEVDELLDDTLRASAEVLSGLLERGLLAPPVPGGTVVPALPEARAPEHFAWQLVGPGQELLMRSQRAPEQPWMPLPTVGFADVGQAWRVFGHRFGNAVLYVAQTGAERREAQAEVALAAVLAAVVVGLLVAVWLRRRIDRELEPLDATTSAVLSYEPLAPDARLMEATRAETAPIHRAIEDLGERLAQRVANERAFTAHAAHALRTPLAGIDAQLALALREAPPALAPRLERVRQAVARLTRVVGALLSLFRSGVDVQWQPVNLAQLIARLPPAGSLKVEVDAGARVDGDPDLLAGALLNLLDNAARYGARQLRLHTEPAADGVLLVLHDDGPGIEASRRTAMQSALDAQAYEGTPGAGLGLGLMLADLVARAHGGALRLADVPGGCRVEMRLGLRPREAAPALP